MSQLSEVKDQLFAILVRDLGYSEKPEYGLHPMRHQFAWRMAVEGMDTQAIDARIEELIDGALAEDEIPALKLYASERWTLKTQPAR